MNVFFYYVTRLQTKTDSKINRENELGSPNTKKH